MGQYPLQLFNILVSWIADVKCALVSKEGIFLAERLLADIFLKELTLPKLERTRKRLERGAGQYPKRLLNILVNSMNNRCKISISVRWRNILCWETDISDPYIWKELFLWFRKISKDKFIYLFFVIPLFHVMQSMSFCMINITLHLY